MTRRKINKGVFFFFRVLVSAALLAFVLYRAGLTDLWQAIRQTDYFFLIISIILTPLLILVSAWKWQVILQAFNIHVPLTRCFWLYMVGYFFNTVLPTNVGGDVVRAYSLGQSTSQRARVFSSVFVERFTGLTALLFMALVAFFVALRSLWDVWLSIALGFCVFGYVALLIVILDRRIFQSIHKKVNIAILRSVLQKLQNFQSATLSLRKQVSTLLFAMLTSFLFYFVAVLNVYFSAMAFHAEIILADALIITPIVMVITMIPVSIGGIGLAESAYFFTFERMALGGAFGLSAALLMRAKALLAGIIGGIYYSSMGISIKNKMNNQTMQHNVSQGDVKGDVGYFSGFEDVMRQQKSPIKKYMDITIGTNSFGKLLKYECLMFLFGSTPGMLGYGARQFFFKKLFKSAGKGLVIGRNLTLQHSYKISFGNQCVIDEYCKLSAQGDEHSAITLGNEVLLGRGTTLATRNGKIEIGDFCNIGSQCRLGTTTQLKLGKHVLLAANCYIGGAQHRFDRLDIPIMRQGYDSKGGVTIEDDVWIGAGVIVLDGVHIGTGSVIGAGSVVTKSMPPYAIARGIPAQVTGYRNEKT